MYPAVIAGMAGSILALFISMFIIGKLWEEIDNSPGLSLYVMFATLIAMGLGYFIPYANITDLKEARETVDMFIGFAIGLHVLAPVWWVARWIFQKARGY